MNKLSPLMVIFWVLTLTAWAAALWLVMAGTARALEPVGLVVVGFLMMAAAKYVDTYQARGSVCAALAAAGREVAGALIIGLVLLLVSLLRKGR